MRQDVPGPVQEPGGLRGLTEPEDATGFGSTSLSRGEAALLLSPGFYLFEVVPVCPLRSWGMEGELWLL